MTLYVIEPDATGHRLVFVRHLVEGAQQGGESVRLFLGSEAAGAEELLLHLPESFTVRSRSIEWAPGVHELLELASTLAAEECPRMIVLPHLDRFLEAPGALARLAKRHSVRGLIMQHPKWELRGSRIGIRHVRLLLKWLSLVHLRFRSVDLLELGVPDDASPDIVPDPVLIDDLAATHARAARLKKTLGMADEVYWFGVVGGITQRKNVEMLLQALIDTVDQVERPLGLALLGRYKAESPTLGEIETLCARHGIHLRLFDRVMSNEEMNACVAALDCVATLYSTHTPNSTVAKAAALRVAVMAAGSSSYRHHARSITGAPTFALEPAAIRAAITLAMDGDLIPTKRPPLGASEFVRRMLRDSE